MTTPVTGSTRPRPGLLWPLILIVTGLVLLGNTLGLLPWSIWGILGQLWPVLLILLGLEVLLGNRSGIIRWLLGVLYLVVLGGAVVLALAGVTPGLAAGQARAEAVSVALDGGATSLQMSLTAGVGDLEVRGGAPAGQALAGTMQLRAGEELRQASQTASGVQSVSLQVRGPQGPNFGIPVTAGLPPSQLQLAGSPPLTLSFNGGIGTTTLDLNGIALSSLSVNGGIGDVSVQLPPPQTGVMRVSIDGGIGAVTVSLPPGVTAQARVDKGIGPINLPPGWTRTGSSAQSPGAGDQPQVILNLDGGIGPITIRQ